jgi:hypothetical protein
MTFKQLERDSSSAISHSLSGTAGTHSGADWQRTFMLSAWTIKRFRRFSDIAT